MVKKISTLALAGLLALPAMASAGAAAGTADMQNQVDALTKQLEKLKADMAGIKKDQDAKHADLNERAGEWDLSSRIKLNGDFRARGDWRSESMANAVIPGFGASNNADRSNDTAFTNRFRMEMRAKALENVEFKGRVAMYKTWGMEDVPGGMGSFDWDGTSSRQPQDNILRVDRAFVNWNNIGDSPVWFSVGRRPTTDGPPNHLRMGNDDRMATPTAVMDWPFDGVSMGYAYNNLFGQPNMPGRVRVCWGRGFEDGLQNDNVNNYSDMDFAGVSWDVYKKGNRFAYLQTFRAFNVINYPTDANGDIDNPSINPMAQGGRAQLGNIQHTSGVYMDKYQDLNYFVSLGWSQTDPNANGMFNNLDPMLSQTGYPIANTGSENGYHVHLGVRYDIPNQPFKIGAEYNHGSEYWIAMTPGHDDIYQSKLATRGNVYEVYGIYDIPGGEAISKFGKAFIRLGYQHYDYNYTGSGDWNMKPYDIDSWEAASMAMSPAMAGYAIDSADQVYATFEAYF